ILPSSVIESRSGKTVENFNTDAEGRLILADSLTYATEDPARKPDLLIDVASLTGPLVPSYPIGTAGIIGSNRALADLMVEIAKAKGEVLEAMDLPSDAEGRKYYKSAVADMTNTNANKGPRFQGSSYGAWFLRQFVMTPDTPHLHFDIKGTDTDKLALVSPALFSAYALIEKLIEEGPNALPKPKPASKKPKKGLGFTYQ
ncbi:MAG: hypothetical protein U9N14_01780, partial [Pseudomonadota bacterium]|nr:hypothetical protein [Pseudomonadota bacterium]